MTALIEQTKEGQELLGRHIDLKKWWHVMANRTSMVMPRPTTSPT